MPISRSWPCSSGLAGLSKLVSAPVPAYGARRVATTVMHYVAHNDLRDREGCPVTANTRIHTGNTPIRPSEQRNKRYFGWLVFGTTSVVSVSYCFRTTSLAAVAMISSTIPPLANGSSHVLVHAEGMMTSAAHPGKPQAKAGLSPRVILVV